MMKKCLLLFLFVGLTAVFSFASVSAQDIDISNMDNTQLLQLLQAVMQKLETTEESEAETIGTEENTKPTEAMIPADDPEMIVEGVQITIYENKKLTVEKLPEYMFIQPTQPPKPEKSQPSKDKPSKPDDPPEHYEGEPCITPEGFVMGYCFFNNAWHCGCG